MTAINQVKVEKVVINMGVGADEGKMKKAIQVMNTIAGKNGVKTSSNLRIPDWGVRPGVKLGLKLTLRKKEAEEFLKKALTAKENKIPEKSFDKEGNFGFGIKEHISVPGVKYDPKIGIMGFDVLVSLKKKGYRVKYRKIKQRTVGKKQRVSKNEAIEFVKTLGVEII
ncbi:MAG: 50S ribosomal protein L5 [Candidatus Diapherotrites archaeon]|jgi:large subunit ribosomal protein L5|uniref:50S ribosomal protein L5 n=1 Tax=Candidatus Iainarchaeum sp. TaxID=3101447 RepID=A0A7K4BYE3_9ARCH|nr:50S ribosomal protein L5 [Candidatus Diapherotrites archaeon]